MQVNHKRQCNASEPNVVYGEYVAPSGNMYLLAVSVVIAFRLFIQVWTRRRVANGRPLRTAPLPSPSRPSKSPRPQRTNRPRTVKIISRCFYACRMCCRATPFTKPAPTRATARLIPSESRRVRSSTHRARRQCGTYCSVLYCTVLYCTLLYCTVLYCTVLYCTVLLCTVLYRNDYCTR
jgi:hypothetical protein